MIFWLSCMTFLFSNPQAPDAVLKRVDWDAVQVARCIDNYMTGTATGNRDQIRKAFLPNAGLQFIRDGKPTRFPVEDYVAFFKEGVATGRTGRLVSADITGTAAMVKVEIHTKKRRFTDYLVLLKVGDDWKIAEKIAFSVSKGDQ
ncbi:nuclear transport factor 2 family protein [Acanthopleuribacter pedis]|uniref:Nuclear transport factor 2 family protein n=1 Tax=Acanthopleuribacter pedis TaxID=442870 RepID=A0A8J7Q7W6_9BACT|nr:nuclear transport factor 2 family protein [Acanthopleuribacter pedis]MBO1318499.1 nuclear transport factor 2 family protein [Acanthopleuribacter pedis]